ncbi:MAG: hypothetical protein LC124_12425 [Ignavibacteriales bacterium]|jgi:hypothetical protein|nr:hypothetical protein [Ignavibacteriota bacterium]MBW7842813.1 hypothetical protein [Ignavibacterium sp.]MCO6449057.1 hypothetical protein [Ignavibacterium album]MCZ2269652.1 hypothetical protein [Ignavibacteriales bacterium]MDX9712522.1 hypothetical protein [Ignavibacteriaceae bacterium]
MKKDKIFYSLHISDIQEIADQDLERELTKAELKKVIDIVPNYIKWSEAISYAFMELKLPTNDELIEKSERKNNK